jgi:hypothetical protein
MFPRRLSSDAEFPLLRSLNSIIRWRKIRNDYQDYERHFIKDLNIICHTIWIFTSFVRDRVFNKLLFETEICVIILKLRKSNAQKIFWELISWDWEFEIDLLFSSKFFFNPGQTETSQLFNPRFKSRTEACCRSEAVGISTVSTKLSPDIRGSGVLEFEAKLSLVHALSHIALGSSLWLSTFRQVVYERWNLQSNFQHIGNFRTQHLSVIGFWFIKSQQVQFECSGCWWMHSKLPTISTTQVSLVLELFTSPDAGRTVTSVFTNGYVALRLELTIPRTPHRLVIPWHTKSSRRSLDLAWKYSVETRRRFTHSYGFSPLSYGIIRTRNLVKERIRRYWLAVVVLVLDL